MEHAARSPSAALALRVNPVIGCGNHRASGGAVRDASLPGIIWARSCCAQRERDFAAGCRHKGAFSKWLFVLPQQEMFCFV